MIQLPPLPSRTLPVLLACLGFIGGLAYVLHMFVLHHQFGFPLDDAWIHLTYARNLAVYHEFSFTPGKISAGSTAPLWDFLLAPAFILSIDAHLWAYALGIAAFIATIILTAQLSEILFPDEKYLPWLVASATALEWHLNWAAVSGMETLLFTALSLLLLVGYYRNWNPIHLGLIAGFLAVTRPEGIVLVVLVGIHGLLADLGPPLRKNQLYPRPARYLVMAAAAGLILMPYVLFNLSTTGALLPNTFRAKQAALAQLFDVPFWQRLLLLFLAPLNGAQLVLLPGLILGTYYIIRKREWRLILPLLWWLAIPLLYSIELPVAYQEGRYEMPAIPFLMIIGFSGSLNGLRSLQAVVLRRVLTQSLLIGAALLLVAFWLSGLDAYVGDVISIDCHLKETSVWFVNHTSPGEPIAMEPIGVYGYLSGHPVLDLGGLTNPEDIPLLADERNIPTLMRDRHVSYFLAEPSWYPTLFKDAPFRVVFQQHCGADGATADAEIAIYHVQ